MKKYYQNNKEILNKKARNKNRQLFEQENDTEKCLKKINKD